MSDYQRFFSYIYGYDHGNKTGNVGFAKVECKDLNGVIQVHMNRTGYSNVTGNFYLCTNHCGHLVGIQIGQGTFEKGNANWQFSIRTDNIEDSGCDISQICGIVVTIQKEVVFISGWSDEIPSWNRFLPREKQNEIEITKKQLMGEQEIKEEIQYEKIDLQDVRKLPKKYWYFVNNSFLLRGFFTYNHLVLGKIKTKEATRCFLGVPVGEQQKEHVMAAVFGFADFIPRREDDSDSRIQGYWVHFLDVEG